MAQKVYRREGEAAYQDAKAENDQNQVAQLYVCRNYLTLALISRKGFGVMRWVVAFTS
jgi:hypothetical protein